MPLPDPTKPEARKEDNPYPQGTMYAASWEVQRAASVFGRAYAKSLRDAIAKLRKATR